MHAATAQSQARSHSHHQAGQRAPAPAHHAESAAKPKLYNPRHPERTLLYRTVAGHFETWLELASAGQFDGQGDHHTPRSHVRQAFRKYLECGIFAHDGCPREDDAVARLGGDEFTVISEGVTNEQDIAHVAQKIIDAIAKPLDLGGPEVFVSASIGISVYPNDGTDSQVLVKNADAATYRAKDQGKNNYQFFKADGAGHGNHCHLERDEGPRSPAFHR